MASSDKSVSPVGQPAARAARRRRDDPAYQAIHAEVASFERLARVVALRRDDLNWTQAELARRMGTSPSVVSRLESGQHRVSVTTLDRLVRALGGVIDIRFDPLPPAVPAPTEAAAIITG